MSLVPKGKGKAQVARHVEKSVNAHDNQSVLWLENTLVSSRHECGQEIRHITSEERSDDRAD